MTTEHYKAKQWRERLDLSLAQLAELTGYSTITIRWFEKGVTPPRRRAKSGNDHDRTIADWVWQRYKRACQAIDHELRTGKGFDW